MDHISEAEMRQILQEMTDRPLFYKLDGHTPVPTADDSNFSAFRQRFQLMKELGFDPWRVGWDQIGEDIAVSTIFLPLDYAFFGDPLLFETMICFNLTAGGRDWHMGERYSTWDDAVRGHTFWLEKVKAGWRR